MTATAILEREVKLEVGLRFTLPDLNGVLPGVTAVALSDAKLRAVYIDTPDLRLMRWGITLRHRVDVEIGGSGESGWTVKLPEEADGVAAAKTCYRNLASAFKEALLFGLIVPILLWLSVAYPTRDETE